MCPVMVVTRDQANAQKQAEERDVEGEGARSESASPTCEDVSPAPTCSSKTEETAVQRSGVLTRAMARARIQKGQGVGRGEREEGQTGASDEALLPLKHPMVTRSRQESQEGQGMGDGRDVQSKSAPFGIGDAFVLTPNEFCLPGEYFVDTEGYPLASDVGVSSPLRADVGFDEPEGGIETSSATETTEPVVGVGTDSSRSRATEPEVGVDPSVTTSSMEPKNELEASGGISSEQTDSSQENS